MRDIDLETQNRLTRQGATLCTCWRLQLTDGSVVGVTDCDRDISFGGTVFESAGGAEGTALETGVALAPDNADIVGVLAPGMIDPVLVDYGKYDNARVEMYTVDWENPEYRLLLRVGFIGQIERDDVGYRAEFRSLKTILDRPAGRVYARRCDAELGDSRCGIDLDASGYRLSGTVVSAGARQIRVGLSSLPEAGFFDHGVLTVTSGGMSGCARSIARHTTTTDGATIDLWQAFPETISTGTSVVLTAGCDKSIGTCRAKFDNFLNFRGFPDIPGNDVLMAYPVTGSSS